MARKTLIVVQRLIPTIATILAKDTKRRPAGTLRLTAFWIRSIRSDSRGARRGTESRGKSLTTPVLSSLRFYCWPVGELGNTAPAVWLFP